LDKLFKGGRLNKDPIKLKKISEGTWIIENHDPRKSLAKIRFEKEDNNESDFKLKKISDGAYTLEKFDPKNL